MNALTRCTVAFTSLLLSPAASPAQTEPSASALGPPVSRVAEACSARNAGRGSAWQSIVAASQLDREAAKPVLAALQDSLAREGASHPDDADTQFLLAAVLGSRADVESGRGKVRAARASHAQALRVLALESSHPGAQYLLGRLHAAVMRMDGVTRFLATRLLGGAALAGASWDEAQRLLEAAAEGDPCVADHHYELARLYAERGEPGRARQQLASLFRYCSEDPIAGVVSAKARALEAELARARAL